MADPLSIAASIGAILHISNNIIQIIGDVKDASVERLQLRNEISSASVLLQALERRIDEAKTGAVQLPIIDALAKSGGPLDRMKKLLDTIGEKVAATGKLRNVKSALAWPLQTKDVQIMLAEVQRYNSYFVLALQNDSTSVAQGFSLITCFCSPSLVDCL